MKGKWLADLFVLARQRLVAAGVTRVSGGGVCTCLLYTSDAADDLLCVDLGGRRIIKKKKKNTKKSLKTIIDTINKHDS